MDRSLNTFPQPPFLDGSDAIFNRTAAEDAPPQRCRYHALRVQWSAPQNCTFFVRGESGTEIIGSAEHVSNGTSYESWVPCLLGSSYNVTIYRLSHAAANAAEIPDGAFVSMPLPNTTRWREPWTPRSRFMNDAYPPYVQQAPINEVRTIHEETHLCTLKIDQRRIGHDSAHLIGGWKKLEYEVAGSVNTCDKATGCCCISSETHATAGRRLPLPIQPTSVWSAKSIQDYACAFAPPRMPHTYRGQRAQALPRDKRLLWRPHNPAECDTKELRSASAPWIDFVRLATQRADAPPLPSLPWKQNASSVPHAQIWIHVVGCSTTSGLVGAANMLFNEMNASKGGMQLSRQQAKQLLKSATHAGYHCIGFRPLQFGCSSFNVSYMMWVSRTIPGSIRGRPPKAILTELGLAAVDRGPDLLVVGSGLWDVQDERREQFEQSGLEARALVHLLYWYFPNTTLIWTGEPMPKLGPSLKSWRTADRMLKYGRAIRSALHPLGVPFISVHSMFSPLPSVDGRHYEMEYSMDWLSVILNEWSRAARGANVARHVLRRLRSG